MNDETKTADAQLLEALAKDHVFDYRFQGWMKSKGIHPADLATLSDERKRELAVATENGFNG